MLKVIFVLRDLRDLAGQCMYLHVRVGLLSEAASQPSEHIIGGLLQNNAVINPSKMEKKVFRKKPCRLVKQYLYYRIRDPGERIV